MSRYETEEEQIDAIKSWWKKNGNAIVTSVLVVAVAVAGWRYWQNNTYVNAANASSIYEVLQLNSEQGKFGEVSREALKLEQEQPDSPYAWGAALLHAKFSFEKGDMDTAESQLQWVIDQAKDAEIRRVAQLRLLRLSIDQDKNDQANALVQALQAEKLTDQEAAYLEYVKGLFALKLDRKEEARSAFQTVLDNNGAEQNLRGLAQIQLDDLS
ncbi:tetratricopeptide repeat protein [Thiomicrorhabdus sp.]|uniref:YfgM family protein n=1 Tax=Thiomicrorhabdus sp. TaxID=2039724 RepID=UPI0029C61D5C|nr:tetratricopeptide repeat protein [Thiomicrorhabdus sp.]